MADIIVPHPTDTDIAVAINNIPTYLGFNFVCGEANSHRISVTVTNKGEAVSLAGAVAMIYVKIRGGGLVTHEATIDGNVLYADLYAAASAIPGRVFIFAKVTIGSVVKCVLNKYTDVLDGPSGAVIDPGDTLPSIGQLLAMVAALEELEGNIEAAEALREAAETDREDEEVLRELAEEDREDAEAIREIQEGARETAETARNVYEVFNPLTPYNRYNKVRAANGNVYYWDSATPSTPGTAPPDGSWALYVERGEKGDRCTIYYGTAITGTSTTPTVYDTDIALAEAGDFYVYNGATDAQIGNEYICTLGGDDTTALWIFLRNTRGIPGAGDLSSTLFNAYTVLAADTDNMPAPLEIGEQQVLGRKTGGGIVPLNIDSALSSDPGDHGTLPSAKAVYQKLEDKAALDAIAAITSGGVISGGVVTANGTPDQSVDVSEITVLKSDGTLDTVSAVDDLAADAADATDPRVDIVYLSSAYVVTYLAGTAHATQPTAPAIPAGGHLLATVYRAATDNTIATEDITDSRQPIRSKGGVRITNLWENGSPMSSFAAQKIPVDFSGYTHFLISYVSYAGAAGQTTTMLSVSIIAKIGSELTLFACTAKNRYREVCTSDATGITFTDATQINTYGTGADATVNNNTCVPICICGISGIGEIL